MFKVIKVFFAFSLFLVCLLSQISIVEALTVDLINSSYHVWGDIYYERFSHLDENNNPVYDTPIIKSYDASATSPISRREDYSNNDGPLLDELTADSKTQNFGLSVYALAEQNPDNNLYANAYAEAEWIFKPTTNIKDWAINYKSVYGPFTAFGVLLDDITTSTMLGNYTGASVGNMYESYKYYKNAQIVGNSWDGDLIFSNLTFDHQYRLYLWAWSNANFDNELMTIEADDVKIVPEPATMLLVGFGLFWFSRVRKNLINKRN